jgi:hypothetical protein
MNFVDDEHEENYYRLMEKYHLTPGDDIQYESSIYIAAHPDIFIDEMVTNKEEGSPLGKLMEWNEEEEKLEPSAPSLTGTTRRMVEVGMSLYNGYPIGLDEVLGSVVSEELQDVLFQAIKIRARR